MPSYPGHEAAFQIIENLTDTYLYRTLESKRRFQRKDWADVVVFFYKTIVRFLPISKAVLIFHVLHIYNKRKLIEQVFPFPCHSLDNVVCFTKLFVYFEGSVVSSIVFTEYIIN